jgi:hypothetical protein
VSDKVIASVAAAQEIKLHCHPASSCAAVNAISVMAQRRSATQLQLVYRVSGAIAQLRVPTALTVERRDELWRHTCAEVFLAVPEHAAYTEFNFAPSGCWAAYEFSSYRQDMRSAFVQAPVISVSQSAHLLEIVALVSLPAQFADAAILQMSLTMVIEDQAGEHSYWAAQHSAAKPDFHCRDSLIVSI